MFKNPPAEFLCNFLKSVKTIAVIGLSADSARPSHGVAKAMLGYGFEIIPVRPPGADKILGQKVYSHLAEIPVKIDLVNVFRAAIHLPNIVQECVALNLKAIWIQEGIFDEGAAKYAQSHGIMTVMDLCIFRFYAGNCR
jgi:uncharacterized protein